MKSETSPLKRADNQMSRSADLAKPKTQTLDLAVSTDTQVPIGPKDLLLIFDLYLVEGNGRVFSVMESKDLYSVAYSQNIPALEIVQMFLKADGVPWYPFNYLIVGPEGIPVRSSRTLKFVLEKLAQAGKKRSFWSVDHPGEQSPSGMELAEN